MKTAREQFLDDVIATALEGGIGYWSVCTEYVWADDIPTHARVFESEEPMVCSVCEREITDQRSVLEAMFRQPMRLMDEDEEAEFLSQQAQVESGELDSIIMVFDHPHTPKTMLIDRGIVQQGIDRLTMEPVEYLSENTRARLIGACFMNDAGELDAGDCNNLVQLGLFGKIVYG